MDEERTAAALPWCDAKTVGPPLLHYIHDRRHSEENYGEWIATLRALNKSWYLETTSHIKKVTAHGSCCEQLPKSLLGSLAHVTELAVAEIGISMLAFDEEAGSMCMNVDHSIFLALNSAANIKTLTLSYVPESSIELGPIIPLTNLKTLTLDAAENLDVVKKCPNLENLVLENCKLTDTIFPCLPRLQRLTIGSQEITKLEISNPKQTLLAIQAPSLDHTFIQGLANLRSLTELRFAMRMMDWSHLNVATWMGEALSSLTNLKVLSLAWTSPSLFGSNEAAKRGFLNLLPPSLRELELWGASWSNTSLLMETASLNSLEKLTLGDGSGLLAYSDFEWLTKFPSLMEVFLWGNTVRGRAFAWFRNLPKLRRIAINLQQIPVESFQQLGWVGDSVQQIELWHLCCGLENDPAVVETKRMLERRGVQVVMKLA